MTATIGLEDVRIHAPHGFFEEEHLMGNEFSIDVAVEAEIGSAAANDDLGGTVNYATIYYLLQSEMKKPTQLLEALAYRMGNRILNQFDGVSSVRLKLRKLHPPLGGKVGAAFVEVNITASNAGGGGYGGGNAQHTYEDDGGFDDDDFSGGGGFMAGGFSGGGGLSGLPTKPPPPPPPAPVFDEAAFADDEGEYFDEGDEPYYDESEQEFTAEELAELVGGEDFDDGDYEGVDFDDMDFDDMDFDDFDLEGFDLDEP